MGGRGPAREGVALPAGAWLSVWGRGHFCEGLAVSAGLWSCTPRPVFVLERRLFYSCGCLVGVGVPVTQLSRGGVALSLVFGELFLTDEAQGRGRPEETRSGVSSSARPAQRLMRPHPGNAEGLCPQAPASQDTRKWALHRVNLVESF